MTTLTIPIRVEPRTQRTLKVIGYGLKAFLTTKVSGKLVLRKRRSQEDHYPHRYFPLQKAPPVPDPNVPTPADNTPEKNTNIPPRATVWPEDIHQDLVSRGIKVRDFAYPATRVGYHNPTDLHPMTLSKEEQVRLRKKAKDLPSSPEKAPMPSVSMTWVPPHPCLRPIPEPEIVPLKAPTLEAPYSPIYETHRIPTEFSPLGALSQVHCRLAQNPRTVPIRGQITRRLLTLSPHMVDLSLYHEMDLEELRRYDRRIVWQLMNGIEPYPWYPNRHPSWTPGPGHIKFASEQSELLAEADAERQREHLIVWFRTRLEDDIWQAQRFEELRRENERDGFVSGCDYEDSLSPWDRIISPEQGISSRQYLDVWERRMASDTASEEYPQKVIELKRLRDTDRALRRLTGWETDSDRDEEMLAVQEDPYAGVVPPFKLGQPEIDLPRLPYWGPDAVWDGYRLHNAEPTGKTLNEYAAELSRCPADDTHWPPSPTPSLKRKFEESDDELNDNEEEDSEGESVDDGPSPKRARTE